MRAGRAFPRLQADDCNQQQVLRIIRLVRDLLPAKREAEAARLVQLSLHEIKRLETIVPSTPPVDRPGPPSPQLLPGDPAVTAAGASNLFSS